MFSCVGEINDEVVPNGENEEVPTDGDGGQPPEQMEGERPLSSLVRSALGEDPSVPRAQRIRIHPDIIRHWGHYVTKGNPKEEMEKLREKYQSPEELSAPMLNEEVQAKLSERVLRKDKYKFETSQLASGVVSIAGGLLTNIDEIGENGLNQDEFIEKITDIGRLGAEIMFQLGLSRKIAITPRFPKTIKGILKKTEPSKFLFGKNLDEKIKKVKDADRLFKETTNNKPQGQQSGNFSGNGRRFSTPRPPNNGRNMSTGGSGRPRLFFGNQRGRGNQRSYPQQGQRNPQNQLNQGK